MKNQTIPVIWSNDDIHYGRAPELRRQLELLDRHGIPGVFFVIPRTEQGDLDADRELLIMIEKAKGKGHEFYQHGFIHHAFECGFPEIGMLEHDPVAKLRFDEERSAIEQLHTLEAQIEMIDNGHRIWRRAFGEDSIGFRPGWGAFCDSFYKALAILGFRWVSSRIPSFTSWDWNRGLWDTPINFRAALPTTPHYLPQGILEIPLGGDYGFRIPNDPKRIDSMADLAMREFAVLLERRDPFVICSHFHGLEFSGAKEGCPPLPRCSDIGPGTGTGYAVHEKMIPALLKTGQAEFIGMKALAAGYPKPAPAT